MTYSHSLRIVAAALIFGMPAPASSFGHSANQVAENPSLSIEFTSISQMTRFGIGERLAIKWKPIPGPWLPCVINGKICLCKGNVADCRYSKPVGIKMMRSSAAVRSQAEKRLEQQRKALTRNWAG